MAQISVIIPCYNQAKYIAETIDSVLAQTFKDFEIIIVNDGSSDQSSSIIQTYAKQHPDIISYIEQANQGVIAARNNAIKHSRGQYIFPLDGDDKIAPSCLEKLYKAISRHKGDVIYSRVQYFGRQDKILNNLPPTRLNMSLGNQVCVSALYRKSDWEQYGGYDNIMKDGLEDWEFWLNFIEDNKTFYQVPEVLLFYRNLNNSRNSQINPQLYAKLLKLVHNKHKKLYNFSWRIQVLLSHIYRFLYYKKVTKSGKTSIKICKIPPPINLLKRSRKFLSRLFSTQRKINGQLKLKIFGISLKFQPRQSLKQRIEYLEKSIIAQSPWWDDLWYVREYDHNLSRQEALDYWYHTGWKQKENPSPYFDIKDAAKLCGAINPILYYTSPINNILLPPHAYNAFKSSHDSEAIAQYLQYRPSRRAKSVIYTCITDDYDDLREILTYKYIDPEWDYVCFTNNQADIAAKQIGIWEIRPLQFTSLDSSRNNRWHKTHPHLLFPEYEESIYIDGNINILSDFLFRTIRQQNKNFLLPRHHSNLCIYQEYKTVLLSKLDKQELILAERDLIEKAGMPRNYGFTENNILYRRHHQAEVISLMDDWWNMIETYAKRDQLSLVYLLWKRHIRVEDITFENSRLLTNDFYVFGHKKGRK